MRFVIDPSSEFYPNCVPRLCAKQIYGMEILFHRQFYDRDTSQHRKTESPLEVSIVGFPRDADTDRSELILDLRRILLFLDNKLSVHPK